MFDSASLRLWRKAWRTTTVTLLAGSALLTACGDSPSQEDSRDNQTVSATPTPDLILHSGKIASGTTPGEYQFAEAVAIRDGLITQVGSNETLLSNAGEAKQIDLQGRTVIPGLNDSHAHVVRGGRFYNLELRWDGVDSLEEGLSMVTEQARRTPEGQWVRVIGGWSPYQFSEQRMPTPAELTEAAPETPVFVLYLYSRGFLNKAGVEAMGITEDTTPPVGGRYEITADGGAILWAEPNPTILYKAIGALPGLNDTQKLNSTRLFYHELNRFGLTSVVDAGGGGHAFPEDYDGTQALVAEDDSTVRISYYLFPQKPGKELESFKYWANNFEQGHNESGLENGLVLEGAGEFLTWDAGDFENFSSDRPNILGTPKMVDDLDSVTRFLAKRNWPMRIHGTYNQSITKILDIWEDVDKDHPFSNLRCAIDHAETLQPGNMERIKALGCGVALQSRMAFAGENFQARYGEELTAQAPPMVELLKRDIPIGLGSDSTRVGTYNPWITLYWATTGKTVGGNTLYPASSRLSREQALYLHTKGSAWFSGEEDLKGDIAQGQYADLVVLSDDYFNVPDEQIRDIESVLTIMAGKVVYGSGDYQDMAPSLPKAEPAWSPINHFGGYQR